jgi:hypothetical protein
MATTFGNELLKINQTIAHGAFFPGPILMYLVQYHGSARAKAAEETLSEVWLLCRSVILCEQDQ